MMGAARQQQAGFGSSFALGTREGMRRAVAYYLDLDVADVLALNGEGEVLLVLPEELIPEDRLERLDDLRGVLCRTGPMAANILPPRAVARMLYDAVATVFTASGPQAALDYLRRRGP